MEAVTEETDATTTQHEENSDVINGDSQQNIVSFYSNYIYNRLSTMFSRSSSSSPSPNILFTLFNLYRRSSRRRRKPKVSLPLPLPSTSQEFSLVMTTAPRARVIEVLEAIMDHTFTSLRIIHNNLQFWQSRAEGTNAQKVYFMMFERGPRAFVNGTVQIFRDGSSFKHLSGSASAYIAKRVSVLTSLQCSLAEFLAQFYVDVERHGVELLKDPEKSLPSLLVTIGNLFSKLEASIGQLHTIDQNDSFVHGSDPSPLLFDNLPEVNQEGSQWTDCEIRDAGNMIYRNLDKLESYLSDMVLQHKKPSKVTLYWVRYTCGAVALSACSLWLLKHSRLMGSPDIDNWICEAKDSTVGFVHDHVQQPLVAIRDELFDTFRKRHKGVMEIEEVRLTETSLHRMLLAFSEQTKGQKFPENASDQEMLEIVMNRYEKELTHPIQNLVSGELARALLIQVQKLKLDIETAMLELDQILKANEINFAVLAALPAFFLSLLLLMLVRAWYKQDTRAQGRGRVARIQRRLLIVEVEKRIMQYQNFIEQGLEKEALCTYGLALYSLDCLYDAVETHAKATGEWQWLREDITELAKPNLQAAYKLTVTSRMERVYDCLLPSLKRP
ncbi:hypothetical protein ACFE04_018387 [Oxalis oulophora]